MLLKKYLYTNLFGLFLFFIIIFSLIFVSGNLFVRLSLLPTIKSAIYIFFYMLPLMFSFAMPIASCMSVQTFVGNLYTTDEILFINSFLDAKKELFISIVFFSVTLLFIYVPFIFYFVPRSYEDGKNFIVNFARDQFYQLEKGKLHNIIPTLTIYFKERDLSNKEKPKFFNLFLTFKEKNGTIYLINSRDAFLYKNILYLQSGVIQSISEKNNIYKSNFEEIGITLSYIFNGYSKDSKKKALKFFTLSELLENKNDKTIYFEFHKRVAKVLWQFLLPLFSLFLILIFAKEKSNLLISIVLSAFLFFVFYFSVNIDSLFLLYQFPFLLFAILFFAYKYRYSL